MLLQRISFLQHDGIKRGEVETIVDNFPGQSIDFFGALRSRVYDDKVNDLPSAHQPGLALDEYLL